VYFFTAQAVSPGVTAAEVLTSLIALTVVYGVLAVVELGLITRFVRRGVRTGDGAPTPAPDPAGTPDDDVLSFAY
jgi:cytochrome d ubiquinol oxidase subunit I